MRKNVCGYDFIKMGNADLASEPCIAKVLAVNID